MTERKTLSSLGKTLSPEVRARAVAKARVMSHAINLSEVRRAKLLSQKQIAQTLQINQASVAKMEKRTDMYISTLRSYIEAMGGQLDIVARFPDHDVKIDTFTRIGDLAEA